MLAKYTFSWLVEGQAGITQVSVHGKSLADAEAGLRAVLADVPGADANHFRLTAVEAYDFDVDKPPSLIEQATGEVPGF